MTRVKFYKELGGILAVFPDLKEFNGYRENMTCYSRVGQHSMCNKDYTRNLRLASPEEYKGLLEELISVGYKDLKVIGSRRNKTMK